MTETPCVVVDNATRRTINRSADHEAQGGHDAGPLGQPWRFTASLPFSEFSAGDIRSDNQSFQSLREIPRTGATDVPRKQSDTCRESTIPPADQNHEIPETKADRSSGRIFSLYKPDPDLVPRWQMSGRIPFPHHGLTHNDNGIPVMTAEAQDKLVRRLVDKIEKNRMTSLS